MRPCISQYQRETFGVLLEHGLAQRFLKPLIFIAITAAASAQAMDVEVKTGAVGLEERNAMMAESGAYNMRLAFARNNGQFVADVKVIIKDRNGAVVYEGTADGPYLFAKLPRANYVVTADYEGKTQTRRIAAGAGSGPLNYFRWS